MILYQFHLSIEFFQKKDYEKNFTKIRFACQSDFQEIYIYITYMVSNYS